jgi:hypothetical protein
VTHVIQAETTTGDRHELNHTPTCAGAARVIACRVASLLGRAGDPERWRGGRVVAVEASTGRLVVVARIAAPRAAHDGETSAPGPHKRYGLDRKTGPVPPTERDPERSL